MKNTVVLNKSKATRKMDMASRVSTAAAKSPGLLERIERAKETLAVHPTAHGTGEGAAQPKPELIQPSKAAVDDKGRKIYYASIAVDEIDGNPFNARRVYKAEKINEIAASIAAVGQLAPGIGTIRDGRCICVAGNYRHKAIKKAGVTTMDFMIHEDLTDRELYELSFEENDKRSDQSALDNALVWRGLIDDGLYADETAIAEAIGKSLPNVNKTLAILKLPASVIDLVKENPESFALSALYELFQLGKVADAATTLAMAIRIGEGDAGRKECSELRARLESPKARKQKESSRQYKIQRNGESVGVLKDWDSGKVIFEIQIADNNERAKLVGELKAKFGLND